MATEFDKLRSLIVGPEQRELRSLRARLDDPARQARDVSQVLPEAVLLRKDDPHLTRALAPTIEEAITDSVRRNPQPLADALFPVIGPAIRKAIAATLSGTCCPDTVTVVVASAATMVPLSGRVAFPRSAARAVADTLPTTSPAGWASRAVKPLGT